MSSRPRRPPAFVASCIFGAIGGVLLLIGLLTRSTPVLVLSALGGTLSLVAALVWRSQLIEAWHRQQRSAGPDAGGADTAGRRGRRR